MRSRQWRSASGCVGPSGTARGSSELVKAHTPRRGRPLLSLRAGSRNSNHRPQQRQLLILFASQHSLEGPVSTGTLGLKRFRQHVKRVCGHTRLIFCS
jgi:hypothetical protein